MTVLATGKNDSTVYILEQVDKVLDKGEEASKKASKTSIIGIIPTILTSTASVLRFLKVPEFICKGVESMGGRNFEKCAETASGYCAKTATQCARSTIHTSVESTCKSKDTAFGWVVSWIK